MVDHPRIVAVGLDSAEQSLVEVLVASGDMPFLASMMQHGRTTTLESTSMIGSGSVWFTFWTGSPPLVHGRYGEWQWDPEQMRVRRYDAHGLVPFWSDLADAGVRVGVFDVPFAPQIGLSSGFEVNEWGPHDLELGHMRAGPAQARAVLGELPEHPYHGGPSQPDGPDDRAGVRDAVESADDGMQLRTRAIQRLLDDGGVDFSLAVYPELHQAGHALWHTVDPDHAVYRDARFDRDAGLRSLYQRADAELSKLHAGLPDGTSFCVFSLHGMKPGRGVPMFHARVMDEHGYSKPARWSDLTMRERATRLFALVKRAAPQVLRELYQSRVAPDTRLRLASSTMLERFDWATTVAFAPPADQHGWIRLNVRGRERDGIVDPRDYGRLLDEIEAHVVALAALDGRALVETVLRPGDGLDPLDVPLPDLVVNWSLAAHEPGLLLEDPRFAAAPVGSHRTGSHTNRAFCVTTGPLAATMPASASIAELAPLLARAATPGNDPD
jgi:predicted AlkP superfamily phosphohydrolase/phosphomutase